jgi:hypothetical protein
MRSTVDIDAPQQPNRSPRKASDVDLLAKAVIRLLPCLGAVLISDCGHLPYDLQAAHERQQCDRAPNMADRTACVERLNAMNKEVARNRSQEASRAGFAASSPSEARDLCFRRAATQELVCPN